MGRTYRYRGYGRPWSVIEDIERIEADGFYVIFIGTRGEVRLMLHHTQVHQVEPAPED